MGDVLQVLVGSPRIFISLCSEYVYLMQTSHFLIGEGKDQGKRPCHRGIPQLELKATSDL